LRLSPLQVGANIRINDSLHEGSSRFYAEITRLKMILDLAGREPALLFLLDELLQGTNSAERATAVRAIARHLLASGAIGAMTTHDLAVAAEEPFASQARLVHFSEQVHADGTMTFDYVLRPGLATSRNALRLMQLIGIEPR
jgi:DNA mismatch repair ATPase MutS